MAFSDEKFFKLRPYLFHLTANKNLEEIRRSGILMSALSIFQKAGDCSLVRTKRKGSVPINLQEKIIWIRDQQPLYEGNISFRDGWSFGDVVEALNQRVFFWPGDESGPISYGQRHFDRYRAEKPVILRFSSRDVFKRNADRCPYYCRFNSGSPRCNGGTGSPRGSETFVLGANAPYSPGKVVEVTFMDDVKLPKQTEYITSQLSSWKSL